MKKLGFALCLLLLFTSCSVLLGHLDKSCNADRVGFCFDARIGKSPVERLSLQSELSKYKGSPHSHYFGDTLWQAVVSSSDPFEISGKPNVDGQSWIGPTYRVEGVLNPLQGQRLAGRNVLFQSDNVQAEGTGIATQARVLQTHHLPPGDYILLISMWGSSNWDRKHIFLRVLPN